MGFKLNAGTNTYEVSLSEVENDDELLEAANIQMSIFHANTQCPVGNPVNGTWPITIPNVSPGEYSTTVTMTLDNITPYDVYFYIESDSNVWSSTRREIATWRWF